MSNDLAREIDAMLSGNAVGNEVSKPRAATEIDLILGSNNNPLVSMCNESESLIGIELFSKIEENDNENNHD